MREFTERQPHLFLVRLSSRLHSNRYHRLGEFHSLQYDAVLRVTQSLTRCDVSETNRSRDIAGAYFRDLFAGIRVHLQDATNSILTLFHRIKNTVTRFENAGINTEECQRTDKRIGRYLEGQRGEWLVIIGFTHGL